MNAILADGSPLLVREQPIAYDQFVVGYGKGGALGVFTADDPMPLARGQRVIVQTVRGIEVGEVLCAATPKQAILLGASSAGRLIRVYHSDDDAKRQELTALEQTLFEASRNHVVNLRLQIEILDVDLLFDGAIAILQYVGDDSQIESLAERLEQQFHVVIRLENLASRREPEEEVYFCDKPDCGRHADDSGGCSTCSTEGGCSTCGSQSVDLREYFAHLRGEMEAGQRTPLA